MAHETDASEGNYDAGVSTLRHVSADRPSRFERCDYATESLPNS